MCCRTPNAAGWFSSQEMALCQQSGSSFWDLVTCMVLVGLGSVWSQCNVSLWNSAVMNLHFASCGQVNLKWTSLFFQGESETIGHLNEESWCLTRGSVSKKLIGSPTAAAALRSPYAVLEVGIMTARDLAERDSGLFNTDTTPDSFVQVTWDARKGK